MKDELERAPRVRSRFAQYRRAGKLKDFSMEAVEQEKNRLPKLHSNDPDIIALARVSGVNVLVSNDTNLHADFKSIIKGKIYQTKSHRRLLRKDLCP